MVSNGLKTALLTQARICSGEKIFEY